MRKFEDIRIATGMVGLRRDCELIHFFWYHNILFCRTGLNIYDFNELYHADGTSHIDSMEDIIKLFPDGSVLEEELAWYATPTWERYKGGNTNG